MTPANPAGSNGGQGEEALPPWEQPGAFRRDCRPHRAGLLFRTAEASVVLVIFGWCFGLPLLIAFPLSLATWLSARRDLALMGKGLMDRWGEARTVQARIMSELSLLVCCIAAGSVAGWLLLTSPTVLLWLLAICLCLWSLPLVCWLCWMTLKAVLSGWR